MKLVCVSSVFAALCSFLCAQNALAADASDPPKQSAPTELHMYDPARDAAADIANAIVRARNTGKNVLLEVGGDWCPWCHKLDQLFQNHPDLLAYRDQHFVVVNVYYGSENKNKKVLARYSKVLGIPHIFVLNNEGNLLWSQHVVELEANGDYDAEKMKRFLSRWFPSADAAPTQKEAALAAR